MKILILNDSHSRGKNSVHRLGDMHADMMLKLDETIKLSKECDFVIHLGDVWDYPNVSNTIIDDWLDRIEASGIEWKILPGNHDMLGAHWENSKTSALAHAFKRCKNFQLLDELDFHNEGEINPVYIKGYPYYYGCEEDFKNNGIQFNFNHKCGKKPLTIACTHSFISIKPFLPQVLHTQAKDINTNYDIILCSHFHTVFDETINNTRFLNLGAWGRLSITEAQHDPRVAILDTETREIEIIKLKSAKKGEKIFDLEKIEEIKIADKNMENFIKSLESTDFQASNIQGMIEEIAKKQNIEKEVVDLILNNMGK